MEPSIRRIDASTFQRRHRAERPPTSRKSSPRPDRAFSPSPPRERLILILRGDQSCDVDVDASVAVVVAVSLVMSVTVDLDASVDVNVAVSPRPSS
jgi:hypothetical protein